MGRAIAPEVIIALIVAGVFGVRWLLRRERDREARRAKWRVVPWTLPNGDTQFWVVRSDEERTLVSTVHVGDEAEYEEALAYAERRRDENNMVLRRELEGT